LTLKMHY